MQFGVPSGYWTYESMISHPETYVGKPGERLVMNFRIDTGSFPFPLEKGGGAPFRYKGYHRFPHGSKEFKIGLIRLERNLARILCFVWPALFIITLLAILIFDR